MLAITTEALDAIKLVEAATGTSVRISTSPHLSNGSGPSVQLQLAQAPEPEDEAACLNNAGILAARGVPVAFGSSGADPGELRSWAAFAVRKGPTVTRKRGDLASGRALVFTSPVSGSKDSRMALMVSVSVPDGVNTSMNARSLRWESSVGRTLTWVK